jgi:hypothetical protein
MFILLIRRIFTIYRAIMSWKCWNWDFHCDIISFGYAWLKLQNFSLNSKKLNYFGPLWAILGLQLLYLRKFLLSFFRPLKAIWHGSQLLGERALDTYCEAWHSGSVDKLGLGSSLLKGRLLGQERFTCDQRLIVLCMEATSVSRSRRSIAQDRILSESEYNALIDRINWVSYSLYCSKFWLSVLSRCFCLDFALFCGCCKKRGISKCLVETLKAL